MGDITPILHNGWARALVGRQGRQPTPEGGKEEKKRWVWKEEKEEAVKGEEEGTRW